MITAIISTVVVADYVLIAVVLYHSEDKAREWINAKWRKWRGDQG